MCSNVLCESQSEVSTLLSAHSPYGLNQQAWHRNVEWFFLFLPLREMKHFFSWPQQPCMVTVIRDRERGHSTRVEKIQLFFPADALGFWFWGKKPDFCNLKPWFYSSSRHLALGVTISEHWTLCRVILTHAIKPNESGFCWTSNDWVLFSKLWKIQLLKKSVWCQSCNFMVCMWWDHQLDDP